MIRATDRSWNSATTLYIARRLQEIADGRLVAVLDMGCGEGRILEQLLDYGHDLYGYDLIHHEDSYRKARLRRLGSHFGDSYDEHIRVTKSERDIPFASDSFDVVYANQVFEHIRFFDRMISECARVLRPDGVLLANFPLATYPIEGHLRIPFAHWLPPGELRVRYLQLCCALELYDKGERAALEVAIELDRYLREETYYRFVNEITRVAEYHFEECGIETGALVRAKIDLLVARMGRGGVKLGALMRLLDDGAFHSCVTHLVNAAFCMKNPSKDATARGAG